jgi:hypothetical protein
MIVSPWFSIQTKLRSGKAAVYHHHTSCVAGKKIEKYYHRDGTDDRPLCKQCARLSDVSESDICRISIE